MTLLRATAQEELLHWLSDDWIRDGPPLCVVEGFTGVGKTTIARRLADDTTTTPTASVQVPAPDTPLEDVLLAIATELESSGLSILADAVGEDMLSALFKILRDPVLIIIDDFHNWLTPAGEAVDAVRPLLEYLLHKPRLQGRLLAVTDKALKEESLSGYFDVRPLPPLEEDEAESVLASLLHSRQLEGEVAPDLHRNVVRWLGRNIHALKILVGCLKHDSLEELMEIQPDASETQESRVMPRLLKPLQDAILARTLLHVRPSTQGALRALSVHRRPFTADALDRLRLPSDDRRRAREELIGYFLLERRLNRFNLNPIAREVGASQLKDSPADLRRAHLIAGDHYERHFVAKGEVPLAKYGPQFVEARHHLWRAGEEQRVAALVSKYRRYLTGLYSRDATIPNDLAELDERIAILTAILQDGGPVALRYHLARLLDRRNKRDDKLRALLQTREAIRESSRPDIWSVHVRLTYEVEGPKHGAEIGRRALMAVPHSPPLHYLIAHRLAENGAVTEALQVCQQAVDRLGALSAWSLIQLAGIILTRQGEYERAIGFYLMNLEKFPSVKASSASRLFEQACFTALAIGDTDSLEKIRFQAGHIEGGEHQVVLADVLLLQLQEEWQLAAEAASLFRRRGNHYPGLSCQETFNWLCVGEIESAARALPASTSIELTHHWLAAVIAYKVGRRDRHDEAMRSYLGRNLTDEELTDPFLWMRVWDTSPRQFGYNISFYFPRLPKELTGLRRDYVRLYTSGKVLPERLIEAVASTTKKDMALTTDSPSNADKKAVKVFYSYAHEDEGHREELEKALKSLRHKGEIEEWHDRKISAGEEWRQAIDYSLEEADLIILLVSRDFMNSDYCHDVEVRRALERHREGSARVVPIIVRPSDWQVEDFSILQALPTDGRAVTTWRNEDEAWLDVTWGLRRVIATLRLGRNS
jgi:type II secretory pathway predicted ATPase ExeA/tetratricopeptide (TPR) repeat protein